MKQPAKLVLRGIVIVLLSFCFDSIHGFQSIQRQNQRNRVFTQQQPCDYFGRSNLPPRYHHHESTKSTLQGRATAEATTKEESSSESNASITSSSSSNSNQSLPPVLQQIVDEQMEYRINLGRAMDTLRKDMPDLLTRTPGE